MGKPVLTVIQGGKSESCTDFARTFAEAGLVSDDGLIDYAALFKLIDENQITSPPAALPVPFFFPDEEENFVFRFL